MKMFDVLAYVTPLIIVSLTVSQGNSLFGADCPPPAEATQHAIANLHANWRLTVVTDHADGVYQVGDSMLLAVTAPQRCYLHILNVTPTGDVRVLWPLKASQPNVVEAGQKVMFPDPQWTPKVQFIAEAPVGKELIVCLATTTPIHLRNPDQAERFLKFMKSVEEITPKPLARLRSFVTHVEEDPNGWTAQVIEITTVMPDAKQN